MLFDDLLDAVDGGLLALLEQLRGFLSAQLDQRAQTVIADRREMSGGARGHAARDRAAIENDDLAAGAGQLVRHRKAGDPGADNHRVAAQAALDRGRSGAGSLSIQSDRVRSLPTFTTQLPFRGPLHQRQAGNRVPASFSA